MSESFCIECFILDPPNPADAWSILLQGPPKCGKSMFCKNFVKRAAQKGTIVYVTTDEPPDIVHNDLLTIIGRPDAFKVIDCCSGRGGTRSDESRLRISSGNLNELSITLQKVLSESSSPYLVLDSVSSLALDAGDESTLKFIRMLVIRLKMNRITGLVTFSEGVHPTAFINALRTTFDGIVEMKIVDSPSGLLRLVRVFGVKANVPVGGWTTFSISQDGVRVGTPGYRLRTGFRFALREFLLRRKDKFSADELSRRVPDHLRKNNLPSL